jgi:DNA polymerase
MEAALKSVLAWWDESGVAVPKVAQTARTASRRAAEARRQPAAPARKSAPPLPTAAPDTSPPDLVIQAEKLAAIAKTLPELKSHIASFNAGALSDRARQAVFARGNPDANIMVIGEAPGESEDAAGKPFVGPAGALLDKMLAAIGLGEDNVYITNVVNWRLPGNRRPTEPEIAICQPFIRRHIALAEPQIILLLGGSAMSALTDYKGITKFRGDWAGIARGSAPKDTAKDRSKAGAEIPALISYHPAYLLRQPHLKRDVWRDLLALRAKAAELG